jgi:hypothetical protein
LHKYCPCTPQRATADPPARVRRLLAHGADPNLRDPRHHRTPLDECQPQNRYSGSPAHDEVEAILWPLTLNGDTQTSQLRPSGQL